MADEKRRIRDWTSEASVQDITGKDIYFAADHSLFATGKKILLSVFRQVAGIINLETQLSQLLYSSNYVVDTYADMIAITGMTNGQIAYVKDNAEYYIYSTADSAWLSPVGGDSITQSASTKIQRDVVSSYVLYNEQPIKTNVINSGASDKTFTLVDYIITDNKIEAFEFQMSGSGETVELNLIELESRGRVLFSKTNQVVKTNTPTLFTFPKSDVFFADDVTLRIVMDTQFNIDGDSSGDIYYKLYESVELVSTRLEAQDGFFELDAPTKASSTLTNPASGILKIYENSEKSNHLTIRRSDGSDSDLEAGEATYNEWTTIDHTILSKDSDTTILVTGEDWTGREAWGLMVNENFPTHMITDVVFAGGNSTVTVVGSGVVPASITSAKVINSTALEKIKIVLNYGTLASTDVTNILADATYNNSTLDYTYLRNWAILHFNFKMKVVGSGSPTMNFNIDGGGDILTTSLTVTAGNFATSTEIAPANNKLLKGYRDLRVLAPVAQTANDGSQVIGEALIYRY